MSTGKFHSEFNWDEFNYDVQQASVNRARNKAIYDEMFSNPLELTDGFITDIDGDKRIVYDENNPIKKKIKDIPTAKLLADITSHKGDPYDKLTDRMKFIIDGKFELNGETYYRIATFKLNDKEYKLAVKFEPVPIKVVNGKIVEGALLTNNDVYYETDEGMFTKKQLKGKWRQICCIHLEFWRWKCS
jgi:hypothetical protein